MRRRFVLNTNPEEMFEFEELGESRYQVDLFDSDRVSLQGEHLATIGLRLLGDVDGYFLVGHPFEIVRREQAWQSKQNFQECLFVGFAQRAPIDKLMPMAVVDSCLGQLRSRVARLAKQGQYRSLRVRSRSRLGWYLGRDAGQGEYQGSRQ